MAKKDTHFVDIPRKVIKILKEKYGVKKLYLKSWSPEEVVLIPLEKDYKTREVKKKETKPKEVEEEDEW